MVFTVNVVSSEKEKRDVNYFVFDLESFEINPGIEEVVDIKVLIKFAIF